MANKHDQPTYKRQRFLLSYAQRLDEPASATDFQKLIFLYVMRTGQSFYEFVPYMYGPYSFQLAEDIEILRRNGFLSDKTHRIQVTNMGVIDEMEDMEPVSAERGDALMRRVYRAYPYYTINSTILQRLFGNDPAEMNRLRLERRRYRQNEEVLFTIGYEGRSLEAFLNVLLQNDVHVLCDVRKNPFSRKYGFSKEHLERATNGTKIRYIRLPVLGIESEKRQTLDTEEDYKELFREYEESLPQLDKQIEDLYNLLRSEKRIALMCFEKNPEMCHRHVLRDYLCAKHPIRSIDL